VVVVVVVVSVALVPVDGEEEVAALDVADKVLPEELRHVAA
jgi:hypothetical protein